MKKIVVIAISVIALAFLSVSCTKDHSINGTSWSINYYEDYLDGFMMGEGDISGYLSASYVGEDLVFYVTSSELGFKGNLYPADYNVINYSSGKLVADLWYWESGSISKNDCTFVETFQGYDIYLWNGESGSYYVYFKNGKAIGVDKATFENGDYYYYDTCRITCSEILEDM